MNTNQIISYCRKNNISWAFFDYFDTTATRNCSAKEIKLLWAKNVCQKLNYTIDKNTLYNVRISSEKKLLRISLDNEIIYSDLVEEIYTRLRLIYRENLNNIIPNVSFFSALAFEAECDAEIAMQEVVPESAELMRLLKKEGCKIAIVSDFYLSEKAFLNFLSAHGLSEYIDDVFVSCDNKANKYTGKLYSIVTNELNINSKQCIMIGDNNHSDIKMAQKAGITAFHVDSSETDLQQKITKQLNSIYKINCKGSERYSNYAYSLYLFVERLYKALIKDGVKNVYFLSREGEFLKRIFDAYIATIPTCKINTHYLYVSRKATYPATLSNSLDSENFDTLRKHKTFSIMDFLDNVGICYEENRDIFKDIDVNKQIKSFFDSKQFEYLKNNPDFAKLYKKTITDNKNTIQQYFREQGLYQSDEIVALVDVGWNGTMQNNIYKILENARCKGFYIGVTADSQSDLNNEKIGLIFSGNPIPTKDFDIWKYDSVFFERILWATHGATNGYFKNTEQKVIPVLKDYESEKNNYKMMRPVQEAIFEKFLLIDMEIKNSPFFAEDFYELFKRRHIDTIYKVNNAQLTLQKKMIDNQMQNFGQIRTAQDSLNQAFGIKRLIRKMFSKLYLFKNTEIVFRILQKYNANLVIIIMYRIKHFLLCNKHK